jgi:hypothetical protein
VQGRAVVFSGLLPGVAAARRAGRGHIIWVMPNLDMPNVLDAVGLISEVLTWVVLGPGLLLLLAGGTVRLAGARWCSAGGVAFVDGRRRGVRWFDGKHGFLEGDFPAGGGAELSAGADVLVYYDARNPARWQVDEPQLPGHILLLLGKILTGIGILAAAVGLVVLAF